MKRAALLIGATVLVLLGGRTAGTAAQQPGCETRVTFAVIDARSECFRREGSAFVSDGPVRMNGITFNPIAGRPLRFDPSRRSISLGPIQLRIGSIVLYRGELAWTVPDGDRVTLARVSLDTRSIVGAPPDDTEAALDLAGDDDANVQGFDLKGEVLLELSAGQTVMTGTIELPGAFTDAEGAGLTGRVQLTADNDAGVRLSGIKIRAPRAFVGRLEIEDLELQFAGEANGDAEPTCNAASPGLRWEGTAKSIVFPTPEPLRLQDVGLGFADGAFSYARASWIPEPPGKLIGAGIRVQRIGVSLCAGPPPRLEGRIALTALPGDDGQPAFVLPDAGLTFTAGDPWSLRAEAPLATLTRAGRRFRFQELSATFTGDGSLDFRGGVDFSLPIAGSSPVGTFEDADLRVAVRAAGFIERERFNAELQGQICFAGTVRIAQAPFTLDDDDLCGDLDGVVSSSGLAVCGRVTFRDASVRLGAGYRWGGAVDLITGACDLSPWREVRTARVSRTASWAVRTHGNPRGVLVAASGAEPPVFTLRAPGGTVVRTPRATGAVVRSAGAVAFSNVDTNTTYVLLRRARPGTITATAAAGRPIARLAVADVLPAPSVRASVGGTGARRQLAYRARLQPGERVVFEERSGSGSRVIATTSRSGRGRTRFAPTSLSRSPHRVYATVERGGVPRLRTRVASFDVEAAARLHAPAAVRLQRSGRVLRARWTPVAGARRYAVRVALPDGRRLLVIRPAERPRFRLTGVPHGKASVRVVALQADNRPGAAARSGTEDRRG